MEIREKGNYEFLEDYYFQTTVAAGKIPKGTIVYIHNVDIENHKVMFDDRLVSWLFWDLPVAKK